jgi:multisubunit Na+/H+ antiporter MnhB subunit
MMRTTGLGFSAVLVVAGAVLAWAVTADAEGIDLNMVGVIMFVVGIVLAVVTVAMGAYGRRTVVRTEHDAMLDGRPATHVERDVVTERQTY